MEKRLRQKPLIVFFSILLALNFWSFPVQAEEAGLTFKELYFSVWPEYYSQDIVVNYTGMFVNDSGEPFNGDIWYYMPADAQAVTVAEMNNGINQQYYDIIDKGDHQLIRYQPSTAIQPGEELPVMFEYRYHSFQKAGSRDFAAEFLAKYDVGRLIVEIRQPLRATDLKLEPQAQKEAMDQEGFDVYSFDYNDVKADRPLIFQVSYNKADNEPSLSLEPAKQAAAAQNQSGLDNVTVAVLLTAFLVILAMFVVFALRVNQTPTPVAKGTSKNKTKQSQVNKVPQKPSGKQKQKEPLPQTDEKKKLRKMLVEGKITEDTYQKLMEELEKN